MKCNIGHTDRVLRMTVGVTLMGLAGYGIVGAWGLDWHHSTGNWNDGQLPCVQSTRLEYC